MRVESAVRRHQARAVARGDTAQGSLRPVRVFSKCWLEQHTASRACTRGAVVVSGAAADSEAVPEAVSDHGLPRTATVGILGGGQLGRMTALAAGNMGVKVKCLDPSDPAPASVAADCVVGSFREEGPIKELAKDVDVLTFEIEHIDVEAVAAAAEAEARVEVQPDLWTLSVIQDKYRQKQHFSSVGVATAEFREIKCRGCAEKAAAEYGFPFMLKSKRLAYDGRGNAVVESEEGMDAAVESLGGYDHGLYAERWAPFVKELAVMVARSRTGEVKSYPVVETIHKDSILNVCEAPADVSTQSRGAAQQLAEQAVRSLRGAGIYGVELFLLADGSLLLNEVAPRPHNSGHYTMDACATSQFEQHLRAILGWPLGDTSLLPEAAITLNILGEADGEEGLRLAHRRMAAAYATPGASVHWYCKEGCRKQRKVGHINITGTSRAEARQRLSAIDADAAAALQRTAAAEEAGPKVAIIMGSDSDLPTMRAAAQVLDDFDVACEVTVVSAHRTPERMMEYARSAHGRGIKVIVAGAGGAAHLPGMVAAMTPLPVIGVPVTPAGCHLDGLDALMSICQMPRGVPVATVAIGNAANAGLLALRILASGGERPQLLQAMLEYRQGMKDTVLGKAERLEAKGWRDY